MEQNSLFSRILEYANTYKQQAEIENEEMKANFLRRAQRIYEFQERQKSDLVELRRCLEYINGHANVIVGALRAAAGGAGAGLPLAAAAVPPALQLRHSIQESIHNAKQIRRVVATQYHPFMDSLLEKMETELGNWNSFLSTTSRALANSTALMDNVQNLIVSQQAICAEVAASELFSGIRDEDEGSESTEPRVLAPSANPQICSTPILYKDNGTS